MNLQAYRRAYLENLLTIGRITPGMLKRILRQDRIRAKKLKAGEAQDRKCQKMYARARKNLDRFEARTGLEGTCPGRGKYWDFTRNAIQLWPTKIKFR